MRSTSKEPILTQTHDEISQEQASGYDRLPERVKMIGNLREFKREARKFQFDRALQEFCQLGSHTYLSMLRSTILIF